MDEALFFNANIAAISNFDSTIIMSEKWLLITRCDFLLGLFFKHKSYVVNEVVTKDNSGISN